MRIVISFSALLLVACFFPRFGVSSTIPDPRVSITRADGESTITWNAFLTGAADVEFSPDLSNWTKVSANNLTGTFRHSAEDAITAFYQVRWTPRTPPALAMITVEGGTLPPFPTSVLSGTVVETFQMANREVTWDEWNEVRAWGVENGYADLEGVGAGSGGSHPVRDVSWYDVVKWCNARSEREGLVPVYRVSGTIYRTGDFGLFDSYLVQVDSSANGYRLPKEAEWEWTARGGVNSQNYTYSGSNDVSEVGWCWENSSGGPMNLFNGRGTWPVAIKAANELGIHDMSGNVFEWCFDETSRTGRRIRGGSWYTGSVQGEVRVRQFGMDAQSSSSDVGFRPARNSAP